ncbi:XrtA system polysaccharide chain length determinant [Lysobacter sp. A286]
MNSVALPARRSAAATHEVLPPNELVPVLLKECRRHALPMATTFAVVAMITLLIGLFLLPRNYVASTTILARESDIIQPLLEGRAVATGVTDRAGMARQVIFSRKVLEDILQTGGWLAGDPSPIERDRLIEQVQDRIRVTGPRVDLVHIAYSDTDAERTFQVTERLAELFIAESLATKERESRDAYQFIDSQVQAYHRKLIEAENSLQAYRSSNADAQPDSSADVNSRISTLRTQLSQTRMTQLEQQSRAAALTSQLSTESAVTAVQTRANLYGAQLVELQSQVDLLLLSYTEQYPDVVRLRNQIADIRKAMQEEAQRPESLVQSGTPFESAQLNPHYQELRQQRAETLREMAATGARLGVSQSMLDDELGRRRNIVNAEGALAELTRDYEVNRDLYQDLLRRRENARVSMQLDQEERGLTLRVQDPATMPLRPTGLRFMHFAAGGLLLAILLPLGVVFLRARFDPRMRSATHFSRRIGMPLLAVIPTYHTPHERRQQIVRMTLSFAIIAAVFVTYGLVYGYKQLHA